MMITDETLARTIKRVLARQEAESYRAVVLNQNLEGGAMTRYQVTDRLTGEVLATASFEEFLTPILEMLHMHGHQELEVTDGLVGSLPVGEI